MATLDRASARTSASVCGSTVPNLLRDTGYVWVPAGALDDDGPLEIGAQLFLASKMRVGDQPRLDGLQHANGTDAHGAHRDPSRGAGWRQQ